jgi:hypothetical protein
VNELAALDTTAGLRRRIRRHTVVPWAITCAPGAWGLQHGAVTFEGVFPSTPRPPLVHQAA